MKRLARIIAITAVVITGAYAAMHHQTAEDAAINCHEVQTCLADGYWMESCVPNAINYFVAPTGTYDWGTVSVELRCDPSMGKPPVSVTCYIQARERNGRVTFRETHNNVVVPIR